MTLGFLLDTNVPSEVMRQQADPRVERWIERHLEEPLSLSVVTIGELQKGISLLAPGKRRTYLENWLEVRLLPGFAGRVLPVTQSIAHRWGGLTARRHLAGKPIGAMDCLVAATALEHRLTLVTRNTRDFQGLGLEIINPWELPL